MIDVLLESWYAEAPHYWKCRHLSVCLSLSPSVPLSELETGGSIFQLCFLHCLDLLVFDVYFLWATLLSMLQDVNFSWTSFLIVLYSLFFMNMNKFFIPFPNIVLLLNDLLFHHSLFNWTIWMNPAMHQITLWMGWTCLTGRTVITSTLGHVVIIGCGILAYLTMDTGKYVLLSWRTRSNSVS